MPALPNLTTIVPLFGILIAAALGYFSGRSLEARKQLALQKGQAYADFLKAMATSATDSSLNTAVTLATDAKTRICIYGSPEVIKQLSIFEQAGSKIRSDESRKVVVHLITAMRNDMGVSRKGVEEGHLHFVLFGPERTERSAQVQFAALLDKVPDVPPIPGDELPGASRRTEAEPG